MVNYTYQLSGGNTITRVSRPRAQKTFNAGKKVYLVPSNFRPDTPWFSPVEISFNTTNAFARAVDRFQYYNCTNSETGRKVNFFIQEGVNND